MPGSSDIITATIDQFCKISGLGRSKVYQMMGDGALETVQFGKRRLILLDSYRRLIEDQRGKAPIGISPGGATRSAPKHGRHRMILPD